ncbi:mechanosensitive ion channel family protein [Alginatibacterium sediminis]|uniref:Small-conductance mechanosensitive channel n=1 Tax=Alginatibacterium sediminis TaxID=2164068 RepID=A0A420EHR5_9ALTE|nr:mechanosensitive ion channel family protein [Alginatibacterium sediminis]RKF20194.1 mechanosensitive ion channel family protein [Alginatibacterium sediminis]
MSTLYPLLDNKFLLTIALIFVTFSVRYIALKLIDRKQQAHGKDHRDLISNLKNFLIFILALMIFNVWAGELQKFAFSMAAFAVAIVIATKEFIQCLIGFFYLMSTRPFKAGEWIQVDQYVGEVSQLDWVKTTVLEIDIHNYQYTGKTLYIPNNKLITSTIKNLNFLKRYAVHNFVLVRDTCVNPFDFSEQLKTNANGYCEEFEDVAARYNQSIERKIGGSIVGPKPQLEVGTTDIGLIKLEFTIFCPTETALDIEQKLTSDFMRLCIEHEQREKASIAK